MAYMITCPRGPFLTGAAGGKVLRVGTGADGGEEISGMELPLGGPAVRMVNSTIRSIPARDEENPVSHITL